MPSSPATRYNLPPGLPHPLHFYFHKPWARFGEPIRLFEYLNDTFGPIAHYRFMGTHIVFINHPDYIREVLINQASAFVKERTLQRMKILLGEGLITSDDPIHMRQRKLAAPAFHRQRIAAYGDIIVRIAADHAARWRANQVVDINAGMMELSLEIVARTLFATEVTPEVRSINDEVNTIMGMYNTLIALPRLESWLHWPIPVLSRFRRARERLNAIVDGMIRTRRAELAANPASDRGDLLSMLIASHYENDGEATTAPPAAGASPGSEFMTDQQVRDEVLTIFLAGYETVANALTWTFYCLSQNPEAEQTLLAELHSVLSTPTPPAEPSHRPATESEPATQRPATERPGAPSMPQPHRGIGGIVNSPPHPTNPQSPGAPFMTQSHRGMSGITELQTPPTEAPPTQAEPTTQSPGAPFMTQSHRGMSGIVNSPPHHPTTQTMSGITELQTSTEDPTLRLPTLADYPRLRYTEQVFAESMRLYPPAWAMGRKSTRDVTLGPYTIPAGAHFFFSQYVLHRSPKYFPDPLRFDPTRHTPEAKAARPRFAYFPFGGGGRQCIGESFAWMEGVLAVATILRTWRMTYIGDTPPVPQAKITLRPRDPVPMRLTPR